MSQAARYFLILTLILCIFTFAYFFQSNLLINWDVSWDLLVTKRLLHGGTYTKDFFDLNPPLVFYEYIPVIFFERFFSISETLALQLYIFLLSAISIIFCFFLIKSIFPKKDFWMAYSFLLTILLIFLIFPIIDFGQREHLLLIFTMPYFLTVVCRLQGNAIPPLLAAAIGILAALGFGIKPYFLIPFILVEFYYIYSTRQLFGWMRIEVAAIILCLIPYVACVFIFYPDYIFTVIPVAKHFYYAGFSQPWEFVLNNHITLFCYFSILVYFFYSKNKIYSSLKSVMAVAMSGFLIAYFFQQTSWGYHIYPAYSMAFLMSVFFIMLFMKQNKNKFFISIYFVAILAFFILDINTNYQFGIAYKKHNEPLITFLKEQAEHRPVYFIGATSTEIYPAMHYANVQYASRFLHLFWMPGLIKHPMQSVDTPIFLERKKEENSLIAMLAEDIKIKKPELILVDIQDHKHFFLFKHFDYLPYLIQNTDFRMAFKPYHYYTTLSYFGSPFDKNKSNLYFFPHKSEINFSTIEDHAIVLTGTGVSKRAFIILKNRFFSKDNETFYTDITLTPEALKMLGGKIGLIKRNTTNARILDQIMTQATCYSYYKFAVYRRDNTIPKELP